ncbi:PHP domain-containing protein [Tengunoibacter tsumagoiensis]|uniref:Phosphotransferase n=1 Tax=Tengunoibacter tsumagoiensis TaxID=2014871 RepID=A0A402A9U9_9CHLR|nr:PHP domain-containing protein [Tengunoibacter tsumagoiensis]GCE15947.1 phosphotransferase [Tengunoibacter tsumagoiensis]
MPITLASDAPIDLHMHTTYSDGRWSAEALLDHLASEHFSLVAVTDHDYVQSIPLIQDLGHARQIQVLAGVEISAQWQGMMADLLCYGFDPHNEHILAVTERVRLGQKANAEEVHAELIRRGYRFPNQQELLKARNGELRVAGDCAYLLIKHGYVSDRAAGLQLIIDAGYRRFKVEMAEAVEAVHRSGGVVLIAHPGRGLTQPADFTYYSTDRLDQVRAEVPIDGIETYYPTHAPELVATYVAYAQQHDLLVSAGSDSHGPPGRLPMKYSASQCQALFERVGIRIDH